jgi:putative DNA methylase
MIPKECKRLAEVDFSIAVVSRHSAREKSIRHGHPSTLHLWWARRPLAACRAMLMALLLPDPEDARCPAEFKVQAKRILAESCLPGKKPKTDADLRAALLHFIGDFADWDNAGNRSYLEVARALVKAAHPDETPLVVDPFAGGGSIPLEALRLGCDAFASDLNPVACLICKVLLEDIPRHGPELAEELRRVGAEVKKAAEKELAEYYPVDQDGARPITYLWARTVRCEAPNCGAEIPLMRSFWLCKKAKRQRALRTKIIRPAKSIPFVEFEIFEPTIENDVRGGTVSRAKATCVCCNTVLAPERVRTQLAAQRGGADVVFDGKGNRTGGAMLLAVVTLRDGQSGRHYRLPTDADYRVIWKAQQRLNQVASHKRPDSLSPIPEEEIPLTELRRISVPIYGVSKFRNMYTSRQLLCLAELSGLVARLAEDTTTRPGARLAEDTTTRPGARLLAMSIDKTADLNNANTRWKPDAECPVQTLARHDIGMAWDFAEAAPLGESSGSFFSAYERTADSVAPSWCHSSHSGTTQAGDACNHSLPDDAASIWFTDPPYYDAIPYAHLNDFFYVWMKRALPHSAMANSALLCPKNEECVVDRPHSRIPDAKTAGNFECRIAQAMREGARITSAGGIACVVFAHKTTEGWESLLSGMIRGGWTITGSWPIATEMATRLNARENASLSASVHLVCRPRPDDASVGDWGQVLRELPRRVGDWMERLQAEGVRGADLVFACIGPALEIFSRYSKVETAEGEVISLDAYLEKVWEVIGRAALKQILGTDAPNVYGEDVRLTALFLWTLRATNGSNAANGTKKAAAKVEDDAELEADDADADDDEEEGRKPTRGGYSLPYDIVRRFCQPLGIHIERWNGHLIDIHKGVVTLLPIESRARRLLGADAAKDLKQVAKPESNQPTLFDDIDEEIKERKGRKEAARRRFDQATWAHLHQDTVPLLDHVHKAMLFQKQGQTNALRELLLFEKSYRPDFLRLANALSALYPAGSEE